MDRLVDIDEIGFYLFKVKSKYGRGHRTCQIHILPPYTRSDPKVNVIMVIEPGCPYVDAHVDGSLQNPRQWVKITTQNVDQYSFSDFNELILYEFESHPAPGDVEDQRIMLWDNLFLRKTAIVTNNIYERASTNKLMFVDHPLYRPNMALIKFIFCELTCELACRVNYTWKITTMKENKVDIFSRITRNRQMHNTFIYCGYPH